MSLPASEKLFTSAPLKLTAWYMMLLMSLSLLFSGVLYGIATSEFNRALGPARAGESRLFTNADNVIQLREQRIRESTTRLLTSLVVFNLIVLVGGTALSYALARQTLRPIEVAHETQAQFASDAAHELRTPLAIMQTEIEVGLRQKKATATNLKAILNSNLEEVTRLRTLTDRLLLLASEHSLPVTSFDVSAASTEAMNRFISLATAKKVTVHNKVTSLSAVGHYESVVDILGIVLENAIKYSPENSHVVVEAQVQRRTLRLSVRDEGPGIPPEEQTKIFERFYRVDSSRSRSQVEGHGLGLALAARLAAGMKGRVEVKSDGANGTTFTLVLPLQYT